MRKKTNDKIAGPMAEIIANLRAHQRAVNKALEALDPAPPIPIYDTIASKSPLTVVEAQIAKRVVSAASRRKMAAAQRKRWREIKRQVA